MKAQNSEMFLCLEACSVFQNYGNEKSMRGNMEYAT